MALLTMELRTQPVATDGNGFRLFLRFLVAEHLPLSATSCNHGAPQRLHPRGALVPTRVSERRVARGRTRTRRSRPACGRVDRASEEFAPRAS